MSLIDSLTPKNTREIEPGLFIQKKGRKYREVYPAAWNGKINWYNFVFGGSAFKTLGWFAIILFIVWAYQNDVREYRNFYETVQGDPNGYCEGVAKLQITPECTPELEKLGLCHTLKGIEFNVSVVDEN